MTILEVLIKAKSLIDTPEKWCQHTYIKTYHGKLRYCSAGALRMVCFGTVDDILSDEESFPFYKVRGILHDVLPHHGLVNYNDMHTHAEVMQIWDKAIEYARNHP